MAKVQNNIITQGLSGKLGNQIVFRSGRSGQTIVAVRPAAGREFNATQLAHHEAFRNAIAYAKSAKDEEVYIVKARGTEMNPFNAAVADWFYKPQVLEIQADNWNGDAGQVIRVKAQDDTLVAGVRVAITDGNGTTFEQGEAVKTDGLWWEYTTSAPVSAENSPVIVVTAEDLPGNNHQLTWRSN
jgi:hypothetical protein